MKLLSDLNEENNKDSRKNDTEDNRKKSFKGSPSSPDKSSAKSWFLKITAFTTCAVILYFIFWYGQPTFIAVSKIGCSNGNGLQLTDGNNGNGTYNIKTDYKLSTTYSEKPSLGFQEQVYRITTLTQDNRKVSFNVSKIITPNGKDNNGGGYTASYRISSGCRFFECVKADCKEAVCCCCSKDSSCCSGNGECCKNGCCTSSGGSCCTSGNKCPCCEFIKLVNFAILNPVDPNRITAASVFFSLLPTILYIGIFLFIIRSTMKGQGIGFYGQNSIFKIGQSISKTVKSNVTFKDVAGIKEEKAELEEIVDYLKNPAKYNVMGARVPKGVILYGPPGTGKTLLAKAVSGEAGVPFIESSGASFDDMFVGSGAKRVRELFAKAKKLSPCIIFIDEIDAVAAKRGNRFSNSGGGVNDQTINQMLSEMDGFNTQTGIVVMAATNKLDAIDEAILRPGRFDRHIQVNLPDISERLEILKVHSRNKNLSSSVNLENVARKTPGFSGAQLENVLNEATLLTVRHNKKVIGDEEIDEAIDRVIGGPAKRSRKISFNEKKQIAYHEAGHAIAGLYVRDGEVVEKITIIPRGRAAGYVLTAPEKQEQFITRKDQFMSVVITSLAGRAAEEIFFGADKISSGASNDLYKVTDLVESMITKWGMSRELGLRQYKPSEEPENRYKNNYSEQSSEKIDLEINKIIETQYQKAKEIIIQNKDEFLLIVESLLLLETITRPQIEYIHKHKKLPPKALEIKDKLIKEDEELKDKDKLKTK